GFEAARTVTRRHRDLVVVLMSADPLEPPPGFSDRGGQIVLLRKQELCARQLLDAWQGRRTPWLGGSGRPGSWITETGSSFKPACPHAPAVGTRSARSWRQRPALPGRSD